MKMTPETADEFGRQLGIAVKAAVKQATDDLQARVMALESKVNLLEAEASEKAVRFKR